VGSFLTSVAVKPRYSPFIILTPAMSLSPGWWALRPDPPCHRRVAQGRFPLLPLMHLLGAPERRLILACVALGEFSSLLSPPRPSPSCILLILTFLPPSSTLQQRWTLSFPRTQKTVLPVRNSPLPSVHAFDGTTGCEQVVARRRGVQSFLSAHSRAGCELVEV